MSVSDVEALNGRLLFAIPKKGGFNQRKVHGRLIALYRETARPMLAVTRWYVCRVDIDKARAGILMGLFRCGHPVSQIESSRRMPRDEPPHRAVSLLGITH